MPVEQSVNSPSERENHVPSAKPANTKTANTKSAGAKTAKPTTTASKVHVSQSALDRLKQELSGYVLLPGTPEYAMAVQIDNGRVQQQPTVIVQASGEKDVVTTLRFAQQQGLKLTVLGGGHSATGYCLNTGGVVLDMSLMKAMTLDSKQRTLRVQMGALWSDVYAYMMKSGTGLIPVGGGCLTVGVPGFVQGGGFSFASRSYGISADNLISLKIVTADGKLRHISEASKSKEEIDLFWALRGGGGGNFGVVTEMELRVHKPNTPKMFLAQIRYPVELAQDVIGFYNEWVETLPNEMAVYGIWGPSAEPGDPSKTTTEFGFKVIYNGEFAAGLKLVEPILKRNPVYANLNHMTLPAYAAMVALTTSVKGRSASIRAGVMPPRAWTSKAIKVLEEYMGNRPSQSSFMVWTHLGGKVAEVAPTATAFPHRNARFVPELKAIWDTPQQARANIEWGFKFYQDLEPFFTGSYVNYIDPLLSGWQKKYYEQNYKRLLEVKRHWDPKNFFQFQQGIGSKFEPNTSQPLDLSPLNRTFVD